MKFFNKKIAAVLCAAGIAFASCDKKLEQKPSGSLFDNEAITDFQTLQSAILGGYTSFLNISWYGRNYPSMLELRGSNMFLSSRNSNRLITTYQYNYVSTDADVAGIWNALYNTVLRANQIINRVSAVKDGDSAEVSRIKGEAYFIRAYAYFDLLRVFARPYTTDNGASLGVPLVTQFEIGSPKRNTVAEGFSFVINDLKTAISLLPDDVTLKYRASKYAAQLLLARAYLYTGDNANAAAQATDVINAGYQLTPANSYTKDAFWGSPGQAEEIFTVKISQFQDNGADNYGQMYVKELGGYGDIRVNPAFKNSYAANDARLNVIKTDAAANGLITTKFYMQDHIPGLYSPKLLRLAEAYFIRAEASVKLGGAGVAQAISDLNTIRQSRGLGNFVGVPTLNDVLKEKNFEFAFEGFQWIDNFRNGILTSRPAPSGALNNLNSSSLNVTDNRQLFPIPQRELDANPNMEKNPGY
jgi:hypothetical protein